MNNLAHGLYLSLNGTHGMDCDTLVIKLSSPTKYGWSFDKIDPDPTVNRPIFKKDFNNEIVNIYLYYSTEENVWHTANVLHLDNQDNSFSEVKMALQDFSNHIKECIGQEPTLKLVLN
ncbi:hypothetical protein [Rodentibacter haemolyticus]|uniref:Uncharacterized protein n=1 Tax=Rodentibacter haemolyticus TaxID=2778911 RepID=A0ABX6UVT5_9PAST|nr:hypothetical protein [Rodentibacter haemolyticus]QPB42192.1 hypothetical protein IHV77_09790 [Rodentibacter haemolyticus]